MHRFPYKSLAAWMLVVSTQALSAPPPPPVYRQEEVVAGSPFQGVHGLALVNFDSRREHLYVVDSALGQLVRVRVATGDKEVVAKLPTGLDNLTVGPDDQVYVSNMVDNDIRVVNPADGSIRPLVEARLSVPSGLAVAPDDPDENLYMADVYALRRVGGRDGKISQTTRVLSTRMTFPMHVSLGAKHVVLSSAYLGAVQVLDRTSGEVLRTIPNTNGVQGALELPDGTLLLAEATTGKLVRVNGVEPAGTTVLTEGLKAPEGIVRHPDGGLIVAEVGRKRLVRIEPATGRSTVIASGLRIGLPESEGLPPGYIPTGVAVGGSGTIYLSSDVESALYRFVPAQVSTLP